MAGIGIKEHLEVNVCPLSVNITHRLYNKVMVFFFPQRAHEYESDVTDVDLLYKRGIYALSKDTTKHSTTWHSTTQHTTAHATQLTPQHSTTTAQHNTQQNTIQWFIHNHSVINIWARGKINQPGPDYPYRIIPIGYPHEYASELNLMIYWQMLSLKGLNKMKRILVMNCSLLTILRYFIIIYLSWRYESVPLESSSFLRL